MADALSHDQLPTFHSLVPQAELNPTAIPEPLLELLFDWKLTWISPHWKDLWGDSLREVHITSCTSDTYSSAKCFYLEFCYKFGLSPLPLSEHVLCLFAAFLSKEGLHSQSVAVYLLRWNPREER